MIKNIFVGLLVIYDQQKNKINLIFHQITNISVKDTELTFILSN